MGQGNSDSDIHVNAAAFSPANASDGLKALMAGLAQAAGSAPRMSEVGVARFRELADAGKAGLPPAVFLPEAVDGSLPSRDKGRDIPIRVYRPDNGRPSKGVMLYIHAGGWVCVQTF